MVWAALNGVMCVMSFWFYDIPLKHTTLAQDNCSFSLELYSVQYQSINGPIKNTACTTLCTSYVNTEHSTLASMDHKK